MAKEKESGGVLNFVLLAIGLVLIGVSIYYKPANNVLVDEAGNQIVQSNTDSVVTENDGKLVIMSDKISAAGQLKDDYFGVSKTTVKLKRVVETYQWKKICVDNKCSYEKVWEEGIIDSTEYDSDHKNPNTQQYSNEEYMEQNVPLGAYTLSDKLVNDLEYDTIMGPDEIIDIYKGSYKLNGEYITNMEDVASPKIGNFRIYYKYVKDKTVTVVAKQSGNSFAPYYTSNKKEIYSIETGENTAEEYISGLEAQRDNFNLIVAIIGVFFAILGLSAIVFSKLKKK